jgi:Skp family chaperone for outer membrane proteins
MKHIQSVVMVLLLVVGLGLLARGQQPPASQATPPAVPAAKVAVIDSRLFSAENGGVQQLIQQVKQVNEKFKSNYEQLQKLQAEAQALDEEIKTKGSNWMPDVRQKKQETLDQKKTLGARLNEDLQRDYQRELQKVTGPISERVETFLEQYAAKRGITLVIDLAPLNQVGSVPYFDPSTDVTKDFINEYNKANPATP